MLAIVVSNSHSWGNPCRVSECFSFNEPVRKRGGGGGRALWESEMLSFVLHSPPVFPEPLLQTFFAQKIKKIKKKPHHARTGFQFCAITPVPPTFLASRSLSSPFLFGSSPLLLKFLARPSRPLFPSDSELVRQERLAVTLLSSPVPKYPPALSSVSRKTEEGGMDEPSGEDGRMRRFKPGSGDINLDAAGGSPCDLCSLRRGRCRRVVSDSLAAPFPSWSLFSIIH